jgi:hypothetical protein
LGRGLTLRFLVLILLLSACTGRSGAQTATISPAAILIPSPAATPFPTKTLPPLLPTLTPLPVLTNTPLSTSKPSPTSTPSSGVPDFTHIIVIVLENKEFGTVIGNPQMPNFNRWASQYTLLTQFYAIRHPSLPNYLAMVGGSTFNVTTNCENCYQDAVNLADLVENGGRTWKTYQEDMPKPCFVGSTLSYAQKHNPFIYFNDIRLNSERCNRSVVPLTQLTADLASNSLPDFTFITPNLCHSAHDCDLNEADLWLGEWVSYLMAYPDFKVGGLIVLTWDEGQGDHTCCGLTTGGGRVATVLISPLAKTGFQDDTPYTLYSLLKTISAAWGLPYIGHAADAENFLIVAPWQK